MFRSFHLETSSHWFSYSCSFQMSRDVKINIHTQYLLDLDLSPTSDRSGETSVLPSQQDSSSSWLSGVRWQLAPTSVEILELECKTHQYSRYGWPATPGTARGWPPASSVSSQTSENVSLVRIFMCPSSSQFIHFAYIWTQRFELVWESQLWYPEY